MSDTVDKLWEEHRSLALRVNDLSSQVNKDRAVFSTQIRDLQTRQTEILAEVSRSVERHDNHLSAAKDDILKAVTEISARVNGHENARHYEDGAKLGAKQERKRLSVIFTLVLTGVIAVAGWLVSRGTPPA